MASDTSPAHRSQGPSAIVAATEDLGEVLAVVPSVEGYTPPARGWKKIAGGAAALALPGLGPAGAATIAPRRRTTDDREVLLLGIAEARKLIANGGLHFPAGGPVAKQLYARHPLRPRDYLPYAAYHREILHERSIEMARYLLALGARDVTIAWQQGAGKHTGGKVKTDTPTEADITAELGMARDEKGDLSIRIRGAGRRPPQQPTDLIWPAQDRVFRLAHDAANGDTFHFGMRGLRSATVNFELGMRLEKALGLNLGGAYKRWEDLTFTVDAVFNGTRQDTQPEPPSGTQRPSESGDR